MVSNSGIEKWLQTVVSKNGLTQWLQNMVSKMVSKMVSNSGLRKMASKSGGEEGDEKDGGEEERGRVGMCGGGVREREIEEGR